MFLAVFFLWVITVAAIVLDLLGKLPLENALGRFIGMTVLPHGVMLVGLAFSARSSMSTADFVLLAVPICLFALYFMLRLAVKPYRVKFDKATVNIRVRAMYGGKILLKYTAVSLVFQTVYYIFAIKNSFWDMPKTVWIADTVISSIIILSYGWNGILRIILLCRRLGIVKRAVCFLLLPVPIAGIFAL